MELNVKKYGKIRYIEPNDIPENKMYDDTSYDSSFNIPHPYEDYSMCVDLIVSTPNRLGHATNSSGDYRISLDDRKFNGDSISFFGGTDGYLTDKPSSITYSDILNNTEAKENLGITNIHITYNSYFYPEVTIKFTDVRGASLMMPHEENYMRNEVNRMNNNGGQKKYPTRVENFFSALFSFPYPEFKLQVKGFYGKKVEYSLIVSDFKSSFNNQTGNFDATVKFIGKMYGLYTDIPMSYLLISPYCRYGGVNNKTIWEAKDFKFSDGIKMPTFIELKDRIITANDEIESKLDMATVDEFQRITNMSKSLDNIKKAYNSLVNYILGKRLHDDFTENNGIIYCNETICYKIYNEDNDKLRTLTKALNNLITSFNDESKSGVKLPYLKPLKNADSKIGEDNKYRIKIEIENGVLKDIDFNSVISQTDRNYINLYFKGRVNSFTKNETRYYYIVSMTEFKEKLGLLIDDVKKQEELLQEKTTSNVDISIREVLGFEPTIKNIFAILMAHLETFTEIYKSFLSKVNGVNSRKLTDYGLSYSNACDMPEDMLDIPPFPSLKDKEGNYCYPNFNIINGVMEETNLIDSLFESTFDFAELLHSVNLKTELYNDKSLIHIPTCLSDVSNGKINPYASMFNRNNSSIDIDWVFTYFGIRCIIKFLLEQNDILADDSFGKCEAYNFWRVNKTLGENFINKLKNNDCNESSFVNFLLGDEQNQFMINGVPCYVNDNDKTKKLLVKSSEKDKVELSDDYNFPALISRNGDDINTFFYDINDESYAYSFKNGNMEKNRPYGLIHFVEKSFIEGWNSELSTVDLTSFCTDSEKKLLLEPYTKTEKDIFGSNFSVESNSKKRDKYVSYRKKEHDYFLNLYKNQDTYDSLTENISIKEYANNDFSNGNLDCIHIENNNRIVPIFFKEGLTCDEFLCVIPHNIKKIAKDLSNGKNIITIPYSTQLFIGMILDKLNTSTFSDVFDFFYENGVLTLLSINGITDLYQVISCITRGDDGLYNDSSFEIDSDNGVMNSIKEYFYEGPNDLDKKIKKCFKNDYLGFRKEYQLWKTSETHGGFKYFLNNYALIEKEAPSNGSDMAERLIRFCHLNLTKASDIQDNSAHKNRLNYFYKSIVNKNSNEAFSDRYSAIHYIQNSEKEKKIKNNILHLSFNKNFSAYPHLEKFFNKTVKLILPYQMKPFNKSIYRNHKTNVDISKLNSAFKSFKTKLIELYENSSSKKVENEENAILSKHVTEDNKLAMYRTLKNLYDKHFYDLEQKISMFDITNKDGEFGRFHFVDTFYNDVSDKFIINLEMLKNLLTVITDGYEDGKGEGSTSSEMSLYSFMSLICQKHNMLFLALPVFNGTFTTERGKDNFSTMFTPIPYNKSFNENAMYGPTYVCFYPHQASQHLDIENSQYKNDGFNITDLNDTGNFMGPIQVPDLQVVDDDNSYVIPAFGVEYGSQKQSIFKNVNINMDNPQTTEVAVATMFSLANSNNVDMQKLRFEGQDLYKIYSNYSYTCQVEMMGCAQIMPMMYFQLNNIPMFRGAYQIIQVEHDIVPGDMTTSFKGVRLNSTKMPMKKESLSLTNMRQLLSNINNTNKPIIQPMNIENMNPADARVAFMATDFDVDSEKILKDYPNNIKFESGQKEAFNNLNPALRKLVYCIVGDLNELSEKVGYTLGIYITSSTRNATVNGNSSSDHMINGKASERRLSLKGIGADGKEKSYAQMGCAVDMVGTKNGEKNRGEASITVYNHIATKYYEYIRQLIWEVKDQSVSQNNISLIHLASYGKVGNLGSDKNEIFVAEYPSYSGTKTGNKNLPSEFLKTLCNLFEVKKGNKVRFNNFTDKLNLDILKEKYRSAIMMA